MKRLLILGAGTAGTIMANKMSKKLSLKEWEIILAEKQMEHYYQPGFLFLPFGYYRKKDIVKPTAKFIPGNVKVINSEAERIDASENNVLLANGTRIAYDVLIIATGTRINPAETP